MKLKKMQINNYRQFDEASLNFEDDITIIAGANNSGKTSIVELLNNIFSKSTFICKKNDIPIIISQEWIDSNYDKIISTITEFPDKDKGSRAVTALLFENEPAITMMEAPQVRLEVTYEESEAIGAFSDYLMELDMDCMSFYFLFQFVLRKQRLENRFKARYEEIKLRHGIIMEKADGDHKSSLINHLKDLFLDIYIESLEEQFYFSDGNFINSEKMDSKQFRKLFNFKHISAVRSLDDEASDNKKSVTNSMLTNIKDEKEWNEIKDRLPEKLTSLFDEVKIKDIVQNISADLLNDLIKEISKTNGGHDEKIELDIDVSNEAISAFIKSITSAKYVFDKYHLQENTQGLGYSNLIYIHVELENYLKKLDDLEDSTVKIFIIEEAEAHMHPQMQRVFIKYLFDHYRTKNIQGLLTTHSNHIVQVAKINKLRVTRQTEKFISKIYDLNRFITMIEKNEIGQILYKDFYEQLFSINFSDIVFSDKVMVYEGDTERMYIESLLKLEPYTELSNKYISFIQAGGAYAHIYEDVLRFLDIKTLIITDIDYKAEYVESQQIIESTITNAAIKYFYRMENGFLLEDDIDIRVTMLLEWKADKMTLDRDDGIFVAFQGREDRYARTLEEAMLAKLYDLDMNTKINWAVKRTEDKLVFSIPRSGNEHTAREIFKSTSGKKTDFMYSVILRDKIEAMLPNYIEEGLKWLMK